MVKLGWVVALWCCVTAQAQERLNLAVTASFTPVMEELAADFTEQSGIRLNISSASTGVLYQQILKGAPFDIFFAADDVRPARLAQEMGLDESMLASYAFGQLVLVSQTPSVRQLSDLGKYQQKIIIANPLHAPYGQAAEQVLQHVGFSGTRVLANNVTQARQYLALNLADVGIIAASVADGFDFAMAIDSDLYAPINQQRLVLKTGPSMSKLLAYLSSDKANSVIESKGYLLPTKR